MVGERGMAFKKNVSIRLYYTVNSIAIWNVNCQLRRETHRNDITNTAFGLSLDLQVSN